MSSERVKRTTTVPGWVKGFLMAGGIAVVAVIIMLASGHGPWHHINMTGMH